MRWGLRMGLVLLEEPHGSLLPLPAFRPVRTQQGDGLYITEEPYCAGTLTSDLLLPEPTMRHKFLWFTSHPVCDTLLQRVTVPVPLQEPERRVA